MRTLLLTLALAATTSLFAQDTDKKTPTERAKQRTEEMTKDLGLSTDQVTRIATINEQHMKAMAEVKQMKEGEARDKRTQLIKAERDKAYSGVLTGEQFEHLMKLRAEKKEKDDDTKKQ